MFMTEFFFCFTNSSIFSIFSKILFEIFESNPLYYKKKPCVKISFDLFCNFIIDFFLFGICSTKGAALGKEPHRCSEKWLSLEYAHVQENINALSKSF